MVNNSLESIYKNLLNDHDKTWLKRKRKINTEMIFEYLSKSCTHTIGISSYIDLTEDFSHVAMIKARKKIDPSLFYSINKTLHKKHESLNNNIFAIDGSKVHVPHNFIEKGYFTRTCNKVEKRPAKRPLIMLSALTGIFSDTIVDYTLTKHFNERACVIPLIKNLKKNDIVILDRGYYSKEIFSTFYNLKIDCIMRVKKDANKTVKKFYNSNKTHLISNIFYNEQIIPIRYVKYKIDNSIFIIATTLFDYSIKKIKDIYKLRWRVELSFKRLKSYLNIEKIFSRTESLWKQELQVRILVDTITRNTQINNLKIKKTYKFFLLKIFPLNGLFPYSYIPKMLKNKKHIVLHKVIF